MVDENFKQEFNSYIERLTNGDNEELLEQMRKDYKKMTKDRLINTLTIIMVAYAEKVQEFEELKGNIILSRDNLNRDGRPSIPEEDINKMIELRRQGWTLRKIGEYMGVGKSTVEKYTKGIEFNKSLNVLGHEIFNVSE